MSNGARTIAVLVAVAASGLSAGSAAAHPASVKQGAKPSMAVVKVASKTDQRGTSKRGYRHGERWTVVDAPTTYVETRRNGRVVVDAPFAFVDRSSHGVRVRAPFVDLYVRR